MYHLIIFSIFFVPMTCCSLHVPSTTQALPLLVYNLYHLKFHIHVHNIHGSHISHVSCISDLYAQHAHLSHVSCLSAWSRHATGITCINSDQLYSGTIFRTFTLNYWSNGPVINNFASLNHVNSILYHVTCVQPKNISLLVYNGICIIFNCSGWNVHF